MGGVDRNADPLVLVAHAKRHEEVDQLEDHEGQDAGPQQRHANSVELGDDLVEVALDPAPFSLREVREADSPATQVFSDGLGALNKPVRQPRD